MEYLTPLKEKIQYMVKKSENINAEGQEVNDE